MGCLACKHLEVKKLPRRGGDEGKPNALELEHPNRGQVNQAGLTVELVAEMTHLDLAADRLVGTTRNLRQLVVVPKDKLVSGGQALEFTYLASETTSTPKKSSK